MRLGVAVGVVLSHNRHPRDNTVPGRNWVNRSAGAMPVTWRLIPAGRSQVVEGVSGVKNIWEQSIAIPIGVAIAVAAGIVAIGEAYLALGDAAIILAVVLMFGIVVAAAYFSSRPEPEPSESSFGTSIWGQAIAIPIGVAVVVGAFIVAIGESYLSLGDSAIILAVVLMFGIVAAAAFFSSQSEYPSEEE